MDQKEVIELASQLGCLTEEQFIDLFKITPSTARTWRNTRRAPMPILIGNRHLYPLDAIKKELEARVRAPRNTKSVIA